MEGFLVCLTSGAKTCAWGRKIQDGGQSRDMSAARKKMLQLMHITLLMITRNKILVELRNKKSTPRLTFSWNYPVPFSSEPYFKCRSKENKKDVIGHVDYDYYEI